MTVIYYLLLFLFLFASVILCFVILVQEGKGGGLGASFGGDTGESLFGTSTPAVLKKLTFWLSIAFLGGCIILSIWTGALGRGKNQKAPFSQEMIER